MRVTALWFVSIQPHPIESNPPPRLTQAPSSPLPSPRQPAQPRPPVSRLRPRFISHPTSHLHPAPCSVPRPCPISARTVLGFRGSVRVYAQPCLGSAALSACAFPPCLFSRAVRLRGHPVRLQGSLSGFVPISNSAPGFQFSSPDPNPAQPAYPDAAQCDIEPVITGTL